MVSGVEWHADTITSIVDEPYFGELCDLTVEDDQSYVAGGIVVHNCRCLLTGLTKDEAEDEGIDEAPETDHADEGFGARPDAGQDWAPDPAEYPAPIGEALLVKLGS